jgi:hypothetical protein
MFGMHLTHSYYVSRCCFLMRKLNTFLLLFYINLRFFQRIGVAPEPDSTEDSFGPDPVCVRSASSPVRRCSHPVTGSPRDALEAATRRSSEGKNKFLRFPGFFIVLPASFFSIDFQTVFLAALHLKNRGFNNSIAFDFLFGLLIL